MCSLLIAGSFATAFSASDKKDDKKGGKESKGHQPVVVVIYEPAWSPVMR